MNLQRDFLLGFLAPLLVSFLLMLATRPWRKDGQRSWLIVLLIGLIYPTTLWLRLGNHVWPMLDSLDRLIVIVPAMCVGIVVLMWSHSRVDVYILSAMLLGALTVLGMRKINLWGWWSFAGSVGIATLVAGAVSVGVARFTKRDDSLLMPLLMAGTSVALTGYVSLTGSITLGQSALPFAGAMVAVLALSIVGQSSALTPIMAGGFVSIFAIFLMASVWWTSSSTRVESIFFLSLPLCAWLRFAPVIRNWKPIWQMTSVVILTMALAGFVVVERQQQMMKSLEETMPYYDL